MPTLELRGSPFNGGVYYGGRLVTLIVNTNQWDEWEEYLLGQPKLYSLINESDIRLHGRVYVASSN